MHGYIVIMEYQVLSISQVVADGWWLQYHQKKNESAFDGAIGSIPIFCVVAEHTCCTKDGRSIDQSNEYWCCCTIRAEINAKILATHS
jgi:hypothetical protein